MLDSQKNSNRYDKYKDSGIEWIGEIPDSWCVRKLNSLLNAIGSGTTPKGNDNYYDGDIYWLNTGDLNDSYISTINKTVTEIALQECSTLKIFPKDSVVIAMYGATIGKLGILMFPATTNQACCVMSCSEQLNNKYLFYLLFAAREFIINLSYGAGQPNISQETIKSFRLSFPSIKEQEAIAGYLDRKCGAIDETIEKQKSVIEKLKEYKQSIITQAVTKGLDKSAPMKDSGIEWIGQIPQHWEVEKLKTLFNFGKGLSITKDNLTETGIPVISYGQIHSKSNTGTQISEELIRYVSETYLENNIQSLVNRGDFIFADTSEDIEGAGNCVFVDKQLTLFAGYHSIILKNKEHDYNLGKYLSYLFKTDLWRIQVRANVNGIKVYSISQKILKQITALVPSKNEQEQIAEFLDKKCSEIDKNIEDKEKLIEKLVEYKKSLIYECVTGKRKVVA